MKRILVVDDDMSTCELVARCLESPELEVVLITNPLEAVPVLSSTPFDLLILDVVMPEIDGFQLIEQIRKLDSYVNTPIIFLTGRAESADRVKGMLIGADDYIAKPFNLDEFRLRVERILMRVGKLGNAMNRELEAADSFQGSLADFALAPLLTLLAMENKTGCLNLSIGGFFYTFNLVDGVLCNASREDKPKLSSYQCVFEALAGKGGTFRYQNKQDVPKHDDFGQSTSQLLLQVAQEMDESNQGQKWSDDIIVT